MERWAAVVRTSHMGSRRAGADDFHADEEQVGEIRRYAAGYAAAHHTQVDITWLPPELDVKGKWPIERRPSLRAAIEGVERGEYDAVVFANLRRATRSRSGYVIWERVEAAGGKVHCAKENLDTSTPQGRKMRDYEIANATAEREEHAEMHAARRKTTVERGIWRMRQTPRGYRKGEKPNRKLFKNEQAPGVLQAFEDIAARRVSITSVADRLGMTPGGVVRMLRNRVYLGELRDGGRPILDDYGRPTGKLSPLHVKEHAHDAIVTPELFDAVQAVLDSNPRPPRRDGGEIALLAGLVICSGCGHVMTRRPTKQDVYGCAVKHSGRRCPAPAAINTARIEPYVEAIALRELARLYVEARENGRGLEQAQRDVDGILAEINATLLRAAKAGISDEDSAPALAALNADLAAARERLRAERARQPLMPAPGTGADAYRDLPRHQQNALLRALLKGVVVERAGRGRRVPLDQRVRVLAFGAPVEFATRRGAPENGNGIVPVPLPDLDAVGVLRPVEVEQAG